MKRCKRCVMVSTRPGITFDRHGICLPCRVFDKKKKVNWKKRWKELEELCDKYRKNNGEYDCIITVSGGKDSTYQVGLFKERLNMNPLGIMIDNTSWTMTGRMNFQNLSDRFDMDIINFTPSRKKIRERTLQDFINECHPNKYWDEILYRKPLEIAQKLGIKFVIWGENTSLTAGGPRNKESPNAKLLMQDPEEFPELEVIFTSYYVPWSRFYNVEYSMKNGFKTLKNTGEWIRLGMKGFEYEQVDTIGYMINNYCKFIKFGFSMITELCSDAIRHGVMTREEAMIRINEDDWKLDNRMLLDFLKFTRLSEPQFWEIINKHVNTDLLEIREGYWKLKEEFLNAR